MFLFVVLTAFVGNFSHAESIDSSVTPNSPSGFTSVVTEDLFSMELKAYVDAFKKNDPIKGILEQKVKNTIFELKSRELYTGRLQVIDSLALKAEKENNLRAIEAYMELARDLQIKWQLSFSDSFFNSEKLNSTKQLALEVAVGIALTSSLLKAKPQKIPALLAWMRRLQRHRMLAVGIASTTALVSDSSFAGIDLKTPEAPSEILHFGYRDDLRKMEAGTRSLSWVSEDERLILLEITADVAGWGATAAVAAAWARRVNTAATVTKWNPYVLAGSIFIGVATDRLIPLAAEKVDKTQMLQRFSDALRKWKEQSRQGKHWARWKASRELSDSALELHRFWAQKNMPGADEMDTYFEALQTELPKRVAEVPAGVFSYLKQKKAYDFRLGLAPSNWEMPSLMPNSPGTFNAQPLVSAGWRRWKLNSQKENLQRPAGENPDASKEILNQAQSYSRAFKNEFTVRFITRCEASCTFLDGISPLVLAASLFEIQGSPDEIAESERLLTIAYQWAGMSKLFK